MDFSAIEAEFTWLYFNVKPTTNCDVNQIRLRLSYAVRDEFGHHVQVLQSVTVEISQDEQLEEQNKNKKSN